MERNGHPEEQGWRALLAEHLREDRIVGAAELLPGRSGVRRILVATTWHGHAAVVGDLARIGASFLGAAPRAGALDADRWEGLTEDLRRVDVRACRIGDLLPSPEGEDAVVLLDPKGLLDQWVRWSHGRDRPVAAAAAPCVGRPPVLDVDDSVRAFEELVPGARIVRDRSTEAVRPRLARALRRGRTRLRAEDPLERSLVSRIDDVLRAMPLDGEGLRIVPDGAPPADSLESFLLAADGEGFLGDRALFDAAAERLRALSRRGPEFDEGFLVPTFDAVEVRWRLGAGRAGSLVPGVHVGVGVTPADDLEFWAAAAVRERGCTVACIADEGCRTIVPRTAGREALVGAVTATTEAAWRALPRLVRAAGRARRLVVADADAELRPLHLPRSFREAALALLPKDVRRTRADVALALARAGDEAEPLVARKLGLAAGRLLARTP